jgi:hypothetical protein
MEQILIPLILIAGVIGALFLTRLMNWYAWGENRHKKELTENRMKEREKTRKENDEGGV